MARSAENPKRVVLFADGEDLLREVYRADAKREGYESLLAATTEEAWALFEEHQPDVVVTDLDLPGDGGGAGLIRKLRGSRLGAVIPILVVSPGAKSIRGVTDAVIAYDVDDYLEKPVHGERMFWRIGELIEGRPIGVADSAGVASNGGARPVVLERSTDFLQGRIEDRDVSTLFFSFFATARSGKLCLMQGREVIQVWFRRGFPVFAESTIPDMEFGQWLVQRGCVPQAEIEAARQEWLQVDRGLGVMLVARGELGARAMYREMVSNIDAMLLEVFSWTAGQFYLEYTQTPSDFDAPEAVPVGRTPTQYVLTGIRERYGFDRCRQTLAAATGALQVSKSAHFILREMEDPYYYENVLAQLSTPLAPRELLGRHPFDRDADAVAALTALWVVGGILELAPEDPARSAKKRPRKLEAARRLRAAVTNATKEHPDSRAAREARIRDRLHHKGRAGGSVASIMTALDKVSGEVALESGLRLLSQRDWKGAAHALRTAVETAPQNVRAYSGLAQALLGPKDAGPEELDEALKVLKKAVSLAPSHGETYHWLGLVLMRMGARDEARITLRRALELGNPHREETKVLLGQL